MLTHKMDMAPLNCIPPPGSCCSLNALAARGLGSKITYVFLNPLPFDVRLLSLNCWLNAIVLSEAGIFALYTALSPLHLLVLLPF